MLRWPALPLLLLERGAAEGWEDRSRPAFVVSPAGKLQCSQPRAAAFGAVRLPSSLLGAGRSRAACCQPLGLAVLVQTFH